MVKKAAAESDTALVIIGRTAGEDRDAKAEKGSFFSQKGKRTCSGRCAVLLTGWLWR